MHRSLPGILALNLVLYLTWPTIAQRTPRLKVDSLQQLLTSSRDPQLGLTILTALISEYNDIDGEKALTFEEKATQLAHQLKSQSGIAQVKNAVGRVYWRKGNMQVALQYHLEAKAIFEELKDLSNLALTIRYIGQDVLIKRNYESALEYFWQALALYQKNGDIKGQATTYEFLAFVHSERGEFHEASRLSYIGLDLFEQIDDENGIITLTSSIAEYSMFLGNYEEAYGYFKRAADFNLQEGDIINVGVNYNQMGTASLLMGRDEDALAHFNEALKIGEEANNYTLKGRSLEGLADVYKYQGNYELAIKNYLLSLQMVSQWLEKLDMARIYGKLAEVYRLTSNYSSARHSVDSANHLLLNIDAKELQAANYRQAALLDSTMGNWKGAYENHRQYILYRDSVFSQQTTREIVSLRHEYEFKKKEEAAIAAQESKNFQNRMLLLFLSTVSILILALATILYRGQQLQKKYNQELTAKSEKLQEENNEKNSILNVVSHDLKAPFNKIKGLTNLIEMESNPTPETLRELTGYINSSIQQGDALIKNLLDAQSAHDMTLKPKMEEVDLVETMREFKAMMNAQLLKKRQQLSADVQAKTITTDRSMLIRILDNLVSNASKFSTSGKSIYLKAWNNEKQWHLSVRDEGPGISEEDRTKMFRKFQKLSAHPTEGESSTGLGLSIVKALVDKLQGSIQIVSELGVGTEFIVSVPER